LHSGRVRSTQHIVGRAGRDEMNPSLAPPSTSRTDAACVWGPPSWSIERVMYGGTQVLVIAVLATVLSTIVARATQLAGTDAGVIYEYDEPREVFLPRATERCT